MLKNVASVIVIFGGTGDLAHRKLFPALFNLYQKNLIKDNFAVIATARRPWDDDFLRRQVKQAISEQESQADEAAVNAFASHFYYQSHDVTNVEHYDQLKNLAQKLDEQYHCQGNRIFYLAMAPRFFGIIAQHINDQDLTGPGFNRLVVEKPFGHSLASAQVLNDQIRASFKETDIFRIDHYLGKEMVQAILPLRFSNPIFKAIWDADHLQNIQVTLNEHLGVEARGEYYETAGALKDMVQNHIMQIITLLAMPEPKSLADQDIHQAKAALLNSLVLPDQAELKQHFVRGQYAGTESTFDYRHEVNVSHSSMTETFVSGRVKFTAGPVAGVPIYFRTGKEMKEKVSRIDLVLKPIANPYGQAGQNTLAIIIDPTHEIYLTINGKKITGAELRSQLLSYRFSDYEMTQVMDGYELLLGDVIQNKTANFTHWDELAKYWLLVDQIEDFWQAENSLDPKAIVQYEPYKLGPKSSEQIFDSEDEHWVYE